MSRLATLMGLGILGLALAVSAGISGDSKKDKDKEGRDKFPLPPGWNALRLSKEQRAKVTSIMIEYRAKIEPLEKKIAELKLSQRDEMLKVLTEEQMAQYLKGFPGDDKAKKVEKDKVDKK